MAAIPIIASVAGGALSSQGAKKAAKNAKGPGVPSIFKPVVGQATGLIGQRLASGFPPFPALGPLQGQALDLAGGLFNNPNAQAGLESAFNTVRGVAETGLDPASIEFIRKQLDPFFNFQREQGLAQTREGSALRGGFYGSGSQTGEADYLARFGANQAQTILPLALQIRQLQLAAAQSLPGQLSGGLQAAGQAFGLGGAAQQQMLAEFLRTQPDAALGMLSSLMGGTPFYQPPTVPNFSQMFGGQLSNLAQSPGFLSLFGGHGAASPNPQLPTVPFNPQPTYTGGPEPGLPQ